MPRVIMQSVGAYFCLRLHYLLLAAIFEALFLVLRLFRVFLPTKECLGAIGRSLPPEMVWDLSAFCNSPPRVEFMFGRLFASELRVKVANFYFC